MDAKPQRIRVLQDENVPPSLPANKAIHQRNKSTSALNSLSDNGSTYPARRSAFVDVSNTKRLLRVGLDDSVQSDQDAAKVPDKPASVAGEKPAVLAQPAQRPMSMSGLKGLLSNVTTKPINPAGKAQSAAAPNNGITTTTYKRNNQVFRDDLQPVAEAKEPSKENTASPSTVPSTELSQIFSVVEEPAAWKEAQKAAQEADKARFSALAAAEAPDEGSKIQSVQRYLEAVQPSDNDEHPVFTHPTKDPAPVLPEPLLPEPDESWEDEPARGDNTTGGATTVILPKMTAAMRHEMLQAKRIVEESRTQEDIDEDFWDTSMVAEYGAEIFHHLRRREAELLPVADYMANQAEIQWSMRSVLMDWLVQVHHRFALLPETLFLCVNYIDRFLSHKIVSLGKLQLVGATALFIAAKYEEITAPSVQEIVYMVDGGYTIDEILKAERFMLAILNFDLGWPGPMSFLRRISKADDYDLETRTVAKYFMELTIMDERFVATPPSFVAAGAHCAARLMLRKGHWTPAHAYYGGYLYRQLFPLMSVMLDCCENPRRHHGAVFEKYSDRRFKRASLYVEAEMVRGFCLPPFADVKNSLRVAGRANY